MKPETTRRDDVLMDVLASLVAAVSLLKRGSKKAAPSDKMFDQMIADYERSIERGRAVLKETRRWRHKKRGTVYTEVGRGVFQIAGDSSIADEEPVVIYRGEDGALWVRPIVEFEDGRFERLTDE